MLEGLTYSQMIIAAFFAGAGVLHFAMPRPFVAMMPKFIPVRFHHPLVLVSGAAEMLGGIGVAIAQMRPWAGIWLLLLLIAVFPANVQMLLSARANPRTSTGYRIGLWGRLPLQAVLMWWVWRSTVAG